MMSDVIKEQKPLQTEWSAIREGEKMLYIQLLKWEKDDNAELQ